jgi:hypothetical protein
MAGDSFFAHHIPPKIEDVKVYFSQKGIPEKEAEDFFHVYEHRHWTSKTGHFINNWKAIAYRWIASVVHNNPWLFNKHIH